MCSWFNSNIFWVHCVKNATLINANVVTFCNIYLLNVQTMSFKYERANVIVLRLKI